MFLIYYIGVLLLKINSSVQDLQAYTYATTVFVQQYKIWDFLIIEL